MLLYMMLCFTICSVALSKKMSLAHGFNRRELCALERGKDNQNKEIPGTHFRGFSVTRLRSPALSSSRITHALNLRRPCELATRYSLGRKTTVSTVKSVLRDGRGSYGGRTVYLGQEEFGEGCCEHRKAQAHGGGSHPGGSGRCCRRPQRQNIKRR